MYHNGFLEELTYLEFLKFLVFTGLCHIVRGVQNFWLTLTKSITRPTHILKSNPFITKTKPDHIETIGLEPLY